MTTRQFPKLREAPEPEPEVELKFGTIGITTADLARFSVFSESLMTLRDYMIMEKGVYPYIDWQKGSNITGNCNEIAAGCRGDWLWILGDDHFFSYDLLEKLLSWDVDVIVPHCLVRSAPFLPVLYEGEEEDAAVEGTHRVLSEMPKTGLVEVYAAGSAGMLVKKHVLDAVGRKFGHECKGCHGSGLLGKEKCIYCTGLGYIPVYFETYGKQNEDLEFCRKIRACGFKIHCDVTALLGHIGNMVVFPGWHDDFGWGVQLALGGAEHKPMLLKRVDARTVSPYMR